MAATPNNFISPQVVKAASVALVAGANTSLQTPTNTALLFKAGPNGARLTRLEFLATATQAATQVQAFRSADAGATKRLIRANQFASYTLSTTGSIPVVDMGYSDANPLILAADEEIYVASAVAVTGINARGEWGDY